MFTFESTPAPGFGPKQEANFSSQYTFFSTLTKSSPLPSPTGPLKVPPPSCLVRIPHWGEGFPHNPPSASPHLPSWKPYPCPFSRSAPRQAVTVLHASLRPKGSGRPADTPVNHLIMEGDELHVTSTPSHPSESTQAGREGGREKRGRGTEDVEGARCNKKRQD